MVRAVPTDMDKFYELVAKWTTYINSQRIMVKLVIWGEGTLDWVGVGCLLMPAKSRAFCRPCLVRLPITFGRLQIRQSGKRLCKPGPMKSTTNCCVAKPRRLNFVFPIHMESPEVRGANLMRSVAPSLSVFGLLPLTCPFRQQRDSCIIIVALLNSSLSGICKYHITSHCSSRASFLPSYPRMGNIFGSTNMS